jgi:hypothetical protein
MSVPILETGSFTATLTGVSGTVTGTAYYWLDKEKLGKMVTLELPTLTGSATGTSMTITGLPELLWPSRVQTIPAQNVLDNSLNYPGSLEIGTDGVIRPKFRSVISQVASAVYTALGTRGVTGQTFTYLIDVRTE